MTPTKEDETLQTQDSYGTQMNELEVFLETFHGYQILCLDCDYAESVTDKEEAMELRKNHDDSHATVFSRHDMDKCTETSRILAGPGEEVDEE